MLIHLSALITSGLAAQKKTISIYKYKLSPFECLSLTSINHPITCLSIYIPHKNSIFIWNIKSFYDLYTNYDINMYYIYQSVCNVCQYICQYRNIYELCIILWCVPLSSIWMSFINIQHFILLQKKQCFNILHICSMIAWEKSYKSTSPESWSILSFILIRNCLGKNRMASTVL